MKFFDFHTGISIILRNDGGKVIASRSPSLRAVFPRHYEPFPHHCEPCSPIIASLRSNPGTRHCELAKQSRYTSGFWIASFLAMTGERNDGGKNFATTGGEEPRNDGENDIKR